MPRHTIHLGNAWQAPTSSDSRASASGDLAGWRRRFGSPTGLESGDRVLLVVELPPAGMPWRRLELNGVALSPIDAGGSQWECDVTTMLRDRNEILLLPAIEAELQSEDAMRATFPESWGRISIQIAGPD
jgi:hypothetical protein